MRTLFYAINYPKDTCPFSECPTIKTHLDGFLTNQNIPDYYEIALGNMKDSVKEIFEECLNCRLENLFATNLIFRQTKNADELKQYWKEANLCWQVHELALQKIDPEVIVTCGNGKTRSAYSYILKKCDGKEIFSQNLYNSFKIKIAEITLNNQKKLLLGLPHLSRVSKDILKTNLIELKNNGKLQI